jgi:hypothetical protein
VQNNTFANNIYAARSGEQRVLDSSSTFTGNTEANNLLVTATATSPNPSGLFVSVTRPSNADLRVASATSVQQFLHITSGSAAHQGYFMF